MNRPQKLATTAAAVLLAASGVAACGSSTSNAAPAKQKPSASMSSMPSMSPSAGSSSGGSSAGGSSTASSSKIMIMNYAYSGAKSVKAGATVSVTNMDSEAHTVTSDTGGAFDVQVPAGKTVTFKAPTKPGSYAYHCTYHSNMHGMLKVS